MSDHHRSATPAFFPSMSPEELKLFGKKTVFDAASNHLARVRLLRKHILPDAKKLAKRPENSLKKAKEDVEKTKVAYEKSKVTFFRDEIARARSASANTLKHRLQFQR